MQAQVVLQHLENHQRAADRKRIVMNGGGISSHTTL